MPLDVIFFLYCSDFSPILYVDRWYSGNQRYMFYPSFEEYLPIIAEAAREATSDGCSLSLVPGGLAEMLLADPR